MSFKNIEKNIQTLIDFKEAPLLIADLKDLREQVIKKDYEHHQEVSRQANENATLKRKNAILDQKVKTLEARKIQYHHQYYNPDEFHQLVLAEAGKVTDQRINDAANSLVEPLLNERVAREISEYPNNCSLETRRLIAKVAQQNLGREIALTLNALFGKKPKRKTFVERLNYQRAPKPNDSTQT